MGCGAFLAGVLAVVFLLAPSLTSDWVAERVEREFDETWSGRIDLGSLELSWSDRVQARGAVLYGLDGKPITSGHLSGPPLLELLFSAGGGHSDEMRWIYRSDEARILVEPEGHTNLSAAFELTDTGRFERDRSRQRGEPWGYGWGVARQPVRLDLEIGRVLVAQRGDEPEPALETFEARAFLVPGRAQFELHADVSSAEEDGRDRELELDLLFPSQAWWRGEGAPFELELRAQELNSALLPRPWRMELGNLLGETVSVQLDARREGPETHFELEDFESGLARLSGSGRFTHPGFPAALDPEAVRGVQVSGVWRDVSLRELLGPELGGPLRWADGARVDLPFVFSADSQGDPDRVQEPNGRNAPNADGAETAGGLHWALSLEPPSVVLEPKNAKGWTLDPQVAVIRGDSQRGRVSLLVDGEGLSLSLEARPHAPEPAGAHPESALGVLLRGFEGGEGALSVEPRQMFPREWVGACVPFLDLVQLGSRGLGIAVSGLAWRAGAAQELTGSVRVGLGGAVLGLASPVARFLSPDVAEGLSVREGAAVEFALGSDGIGCDGLELSSASGDDWLRMDGGWSPETRSLDLRVTVPMSALADGAVPFLDENRDLIGSQVEVPLVVRGSLEAPTIEVDAVFRAEVLETVLGSVRGMVDYVDESVGQPLEQKTMQLFEELGNLLKSQE